MSTAHWSDATAQITEKQAHTETAKPSPKNNDDEGYDDEGDDDE